MSQAKFKVAGLSLNHGDKTQICAILNVTPDSFSDGSLWFKPDDAIKHARDLVEAGATILDIGGESTRPGSTPVPVEEEIKRIVPVIQAIREESNIPISVDTWKAEVADAALEVGADIINDITGFMGDPQMAAVVAKYEAGAILMFNPAVARPEHKSAQNFPHFYSENPFSESELKEFAQMPIMDLCKRYLESSLRRAKEVGIPDDKILLDPGIGFALTKRENLSLIKHLPELYDFGYCIFLGVSRKRFIMNIAQEAGVNVDMDTEEGFANRDLASAYLTALAASQGIEVIRTHSVKEHVPAIAIGHAVFTADEQEDISFGQYKK